MASQVSPIDPRRTMALDAILFIWHYRCSGAFREGHVGSTQQVQSKAQESEVEVVHRSGEEGARMGRAFGSLRYSDAWRSRRNGAEPGL